MGLEQGEIAGLEYFPEVVNVDQEDALLDLVASLEFRSITMRGMTARRRVACFGFDYQYQGRSVVEMEPIPQELLNVKAQCSETAGVVDSFDQVIVSCYPPGAGIGWHVDSPVFGDVILGMSLGSAARLQFRIRGSSRMAASLLVSSRSLYMLSGPARTEWQHRVAPVKDVRYSLTFRTVQP